MRTSIFYTLFLSGLAACQSQKPAAKAENFDREALDFATSIVETYFKNDCPSFLSKVSDSLYILDGDGHVSRSEIGDARLCSALERAVRNREKTFEDYKNMYQMRIMRLEELQKHMKLPAYYQAEPSDRFFVGGERKPSHSQEATFIWDDMYFFMLRKTKKGWLLRGISG